MALPLPNTTAVQITRLTKALYNAAPGNTYMTAFTADAGTTTASMTTFANWFAGTVSTDAATLASTVVTNIGLTGDAATAGTAYLTAQFAANPGNYGRVILDAMNALSTLTSDATYGAAASTFNDSIATSYAYSIDTDNTSTNLATLQAADEPVAAGTGQTFTLTTGIDTLTGTSGNDIFQGDSANIGGLDAIAGGNGTDTLSLTSSANATLNGSQITGIETLSANATAATALTLGSITGVTTVTNNGSTAALTVGVGANSLAALAAINISNTTQNTTIVTQEAAVTGSADAMTVTLNNVTGAAQVNLDTETATATVAGAIETLNVVSSGSVANSITLASNDTQGVGTINISGSAAVTVALNGSVTTDAIVINAGTATGNVSVSAIGAGNTFAGVATGHTITGGSGNDTFTFGANYIGAEAALAGGTRDTVNGGAGTDRISMTMARVVAASTTAQANLTSIEALTVSDAWTTGQAMNITRFADVTAVTLAAGTTGTSTMTVNSGTAVTLAGNTINDAVTTFAVGGIGTTDTMTLNMAGFDWLTGGTAKVATTGIETLNINTGSTVTDAAVIDGTTIMTTSAGAGGGSIVVTGANAMTFTGAVTAASINASALTGVLTVTGAVANAVTITGGSAGDTINGSASADLITGGEGADTITAAAGDDSISLTETTAAIDTVVFSAIASQGSDTITGFGSNDLINVELLAGGNVGFESAEIVGAAENVATGTAYVFATDGTAANLATGGVATISDFTNMTQVATYLEERFNVADNDVAVFVASVGATTYVYNMTDVGVDNTISAADLSLVGTISQSAALTVANVTFTA